MSPYAQTWGRAGLAFAPAWTLVRTLAEEFTRATAAAHRHERLKHGPRGGVAPDAARRIFLEFYAGA